VSNTDFNTEATEGAPAIDVQTRARAMGWRPKEEFRGPPERWVDAEKFIDVAEQEVPVLRERLNSMTTQFARTERELKEVKDALGETKQVLNDFREFASLGEKRAYERALKELQAKRDVAVAHADVETHREVQAEIEELQRTAKPATPAKTETREEQPPQRRLPDPDPVVTAWVSANPWFTSDPVLNALAKAEEQRIVNDHPGLSASERLAHVKAEVQRRFPEKFSNPRREGVSEVTQPGGGQTRRSHGWTYDDLPPDARKMCDKFVSQMAGGKKPYTREEYVKEYFAGQEKS
jgi:hypothetical protein